jgi:DNA repair exonuclease SbcCD ATPase subunit
MRAVTRIVSIIFVPVLMLAVARTAVAADTKEAMEKLKALSQSAAASYGDGDFDKTRSQLQEAIALAKDNGLGSNRIMAQIYLLFGVLKINEHKDTDAGVRYFAKAIDISPAVKIPPTMATKAVKAAFAKAEDVDPSTIGDLTEADAPVTSKKPSKKEKEKEEAAAAAAAAAEEKAREKEEKASAATAAADTKKQAAEEKKRAAEDRKRTDAESKQLVDDLAQARAAESQLKSDKEKLQRDKQERDKMLADAKGLLAQLEKEKAAKDKQLEAANAKIQQLEKEKADRDQKLGPANAKIQQLEKEKAEKDKQIAALTASGQKEREAKEKLQGEKPEREKQLADAKARILQLEKEKADRDKQIANLSASDKKERESREKLEKTMADVAARERERRSKELEDRQEKEKLAEGGELPGHIREAVMCDLPDEVTAGEDLYVHCVPQPGVGAKLLAFYYRSGGSALYNAVMLERSRKGWYVATIPGGRVSGRLIHYYVEARDAKEKVAATNGKASSPNVLTVKPAGAIPAANKHGKR